MQDYINQLNEAQRAAVINTEGAALVIAGAGSGKTRVLTFRIAHLLSKGVPPHNVLALTFTNKAAREMKERIGHVIGAEKANALWMGTFHSIFAKILRSEAEQLGYPKSFTIYDAEDSKSIIKSIIKDLQLDDKTYKISSVYGRISKAKNNLVTADAYEANTQLRLTDEKTRVPEIYKIYKIYTAKCRQSGAMDFDDLLLNINIMFRDFPETLAKYQKRFGYILVDEYQDTNFSQYLIVKKLAEAHGNLCVVGDDAQSIYSFRGAKIENILNFQRDYKNYKLFKLEQNYRSTQNIVNAANSVIEKNKNQIPKDVFSDNEQGAKIQVIEALNDNEEGFLVAAKIFDSVYSAHTEYLDHAILYRTNAQSRIFEEALRKRNMPYKIYGGTSFYQRKEIKDVLAYFKLVINKKDNEALKRIINYPKRGIGQTTVDKLEGFATNANKSMWEVIQDMAVIDVGLNGRAMNQIFGFAGVIETFTSKLQIVDAHTLAYEIATSSGILQDLYQDKAPEAIQRHENVQELLNGIKEFCGQFPEETPATLDQFIESISLLTDQDTDGNEDKNKITLMTIHSAKGLEFKNVYIVGAEEKLFPSEMSSFAPHELEEERRLFYVAVTRAEKNLTISYARQRYKWGNLNDCIPSRFIREIDDKYLDKSGVRSETDDYNQDPDVSGIDKLFGAKSKFSQNSFADRLKQREKSPEKPITKTPPINLPEQLRPFQRQTQAVENQNNKQQIGELFVGAKVSHERFGQGEIMMLEGEGHETKATVKFASAGIKQLLLKFAKLKMIG